MLGKRNSGEGSFAVIPFLSAPISILFCWKKIIVSGYLLKYLSLAFISLSIAWEVMRGSKWQGPICEPFTKLGPSDGVMCCFLPGWRWLKCLAKISAAFSVPPSQCSGPKQTTRSSLIEPPLYCFLPWLRTLTAEHRLIPIPLIFCLLNGSHPSSLSPVYRAS